MESLEGYKILGLLSVILSWAAIGIVLIGRPRDISKSISHHAAQRDGAYKVFAVIMTASLLLMLFFIVKWLIPAFRLPGIIIFISSVAVLLQLIATWVPLTEGKKYTIHHLCSNGSAGLIPFIPLSLMLSGHVRGAGAIINIVAFLVMMSLWYLFWFVPQSHRHYLWYQNVYILVFHTSLMTVSYLS